MRVCEITNASCEDAEGRGDGAYSLLDVSGSPEEIGKAIADALKEGDLGSGNRSAINDGKELFLNVRIKFKA